MHSIFVVRGLELFSDLLRFQDRICTNFLAFVVRIAKVGIIK
jgi:hypothetical protein